MIVPNFLGDIPGESVVIAEGTDFERARAAT